MIYTYGIWTYQELVSQLGLDKPRILLNTPSGPFMAGASSPRLQLFTQNNQCVSCGRVGVLWLLQSSHPRDNPHLNFFALEENDTLVLMTKDHIVPKSKGGSNELSNFQTMCHRCNERKGSMNDQEFKLQHTAA